MCFVVRMRTGQVYICGGFNGHECLSSAEVYAPSINQWTVIQGMRNRRSGIGAIALDGMVYAVGTLTRRTAVQRHVTFFAICQLFRRKPRYKSMIFEEIRASALSHDHNWSRYWMWLLSG